jgi:hypothetical protein
MCPFQHGKGDRNFEAKQYRYYRTLKPKDAALLSKITSSLGDGLSAVGISRPTKTMTRIYTESSTESRYQLSREKYAKSRKAGDRGKM